MNRGSLLKKAECGAILSLVMLAVAMLITIGVGIIALSMHGRMMSVQTGNQIAARCAADAAIATAISQMNEKLKAEPWDDLSLPAASGVDLINCDASFDYTVSKNSGTYTIDATGKSNSSVCVVNSTLRLKSPFDFAVFARDYLELKNNAVVNWYNNEPNDWPLQVGTSSTGAGAVTLKNGTTIYGDVVVGVGGDPQTVIDGSSGATITGSIYAMLDEPVLPAVVVPAYLQVMPESSKITGNMTISSSGKYKGIDLGNSKEIIIDEPVVLYVTGDIILGNSAKITIGGSDDTDNDASLVIYLAGDFEGKNGSELNNLTSDATRLTMYCLDTCESVILKNSLDFYGAIYAPNAAIELKNSAALNGSVVGRTVIQKGSSIVNYDAALRDRTVNDAAVRFAVQRWSEQ